MNDDALVIQYNGHERTGSIRPLTHYTHSFAAIDNFALPPLGGNAQPSVMSRRFRFACAALRSMYRQECKIKRRTTIAPVGRYFARSSQKIVMQHFIFPTYQDCR